MALANLMVEAGPAIYYTKELRDVLEDHMTFLRESASSLQAVSPSDAYHFQANLFGYLRKLRISLELHWVIMRLNNWTSPRQFSHDVTFIYIPDAKVISQIQQSFSSGNRIN